MEILYVGNLLSSKDLNYTNTGNTAGEKFQVNLLKNLAKVGNHNISILSQKPLGFYPKVKKILFQQSVDFVLNENISAMFLKFINLPIIKQICFSSQTFNAAKKWVNKHNGDRVILCYNAPYQISKPLIKIAKKYKVKVVCLLADPPIYEESNIIKRKMKDFFGNKEKKMIRFYDGLIVLNEQAAIDFFGKTNYIVINGGTSYTNFEQSIHNNNNIVYTGALTKYNGIIELIEATRIMKSNLKVEFYGVGPLKDAIVEEARTNNKIFFGGNLPHKEIISIQRNAKYLINPRRIHDDISKYTFPSKLFEYFGSKRPIITTRLNGISQYYSEYLNFSESDSSASIASAIDELDSSDYRKLMDKAINGFNYLNENYNWKTQAENILHFLEKTSSTKTKEEE